jgi:hypothetical protein
MTDDWKGESLIRGRKPSQKQRHSNGMSALVAAAHEKRRQAGLLPPGHAFHDRFVRTVFSDMAKAAREEGGDK